MRTISFKSVLDAILRRHSFDPREQVSSDTALATTEHINARVKRAWFLWEWPEWTVTEERAYRQIWNDTRQFYKVSPLTGKPDEVFYIPNAATHSLKDAGYYRVKEDAISDPPIGTPPQIAAPYTYWEPFSPDTYVAYDQVCRRRIGEVLDVYADNPVVTKPPRCLAHRPSENGIQIYDASGLLTVFIKYLTPAPEFTMLPYIGPKVYQPGKRVFQILDGECYRAIVETHDQAPPNTNYWRLEPFPDVLAQYVKAGAYCDCLRETPTEEGDPGRLQRMSLADAEAEEELNRQINRLQAQGQSYQYLPFGVVIPGAARGALCSTPGYVLQGGGPDYGPVVPTGNGSTTINTACETEGYAPSTPVPPTSAVAWEWHPEIVSLTGPATPSLAGLSTTGKTIGSKVEIAIAGAGQEWKLVAGAKDPLDPGHVTPGDYNLATNNKHWEKVA